MDQLYSKLVHFSKSGNVAEVANVLDEGISVNARGPQGRDEGRAALHYAVAGEHIELAKLLIQRSANVDIESKLHDDYGATPLQLASEIGNCEMVEVLLKAGADTEAMDDEKLRAIHVAAAHGRLDVMKMLARHKCDLYARTGDQSSALHFAAAKGSLDVVMWLVENGVNPNLKKRGGKTAKDLADKFGHKDVKMFLKSPFNRTGNQKARSSFGLRKSKRKNKQPPFQVNPSNQRNSPSQQPKDVSPGSSRTSGQKTLGSMPPSFRESVSSSSTAENSITTHSTALASNFGRNEDTLNSRSSRASGRHQSKRNVSQRSQSAGRPFRDEADRMQPSFKSSDNLDRQSQGSFGRQQNDRRDPYTQQIQQQQQQIQQRQQQPMQQQANVSALSEENESHLRTIANMEKETENLHQLIRTLTDQNEKYQRDLLAYRDREAEAMAREENKRQALASQDQEIIRLSRECKQISDNTQKVKTAHEDRIRVLEERDKANKRELERAREENQNLSYMLQESGRTGTRALEYQEKFRARVTELEQKEADSQQTVFNLRREIDNLSQQLLNSNQRLLNDKERNNDSLQELIQQDAVNNKTIATLKMEVDDLSRKLAASEQKAFTIQSQQQSGLSELLEQDAANRKTIDRMRGNIEDLTRKLAATEQKLESCMNKDRISEIERENSSNRQTISTLRGQVEFLVGKLDDSHKQDEVIQSLKQQIDQLNSELSQRNGKLATMQNAQHQILSRHKREVDQQANDRQIQQQTTIQELLQKDSASQVALIKHKREIKELEEELQDIKTDFFNYKEEQRVKIKKYENEELENRKTISTLMKEVDNLTKRLRDGGHMTQNTKLDQRVRELESEVDAKTRKADELTAENRDLKSKLNQSNDQRFQLQNHSAELEAVIKAKTVTIDLLESDKKILESKLSQAEQRTDSTKSQREQHLREDLEKLENQDRRNQQNISGLKDEVIRLTRQLNETQSNLMTSRNKFKDMDSSIKHTEETYKQNILSLETKASRLSNELHESQMDNKAIQTKLIRTENQLLEMGKIKGESAALEKKIVKLTKELQESKQNATKPMNDGQRKSLENTIMVKDTKIEVLERKIRKMEQELQTAHESKPQNESSDYHQLIREREAKISSLESKLIVTERQLKDIQSKSVDHNSTSTDHKVKELEKVLKDTQATLEQQETDFHEWRSDELRSREREVEALKQKIEYLTNKLEEDSD